MKPRYILISVLFLFVTSLMVFDAVFNEANSHTSGAAAMRTGSPGDGGATCKNCHAGPTPTTQAGLITSTIPPAGYTAGQTYTITATIARSGHTKFGFEISPQNITGTLLGTLIVTNTTEMQLVGTGKYITHKSAGVTGTNSRTWVFNWTAPAAGTGNVTFYGAFNITNAMNNSSGDTCVLSTLTVSECVTPTQPGAISGDAVICVNVAGTHTYSISPVPGATAYNWTFPSGWSGSSTTTSIVLTPGTSSGNISVTAQNSCGTSSARTLAVSVDQLSVSASATAVSCNGGNNGTATATPASGVPPYTYSWVPGGGNSATVSNLAAGTYTVTVTDGAGCASTSSATVTEPTALSSAATSGSAHCGGANGNATASASGGTAPYTYSWNTVPVQTTIMAVNLAPGNYTVTVTDAHGCVSNASTTVSNVAGPVASISSSVNVNCNGAATGSATATQTGGTAPFTYAWSPAGGSSATASNLPAGNYTVTVTDANSCTSTANVSITQPPAIVLNTNVINSTCGNPNGSASVFASGGTAGYTYSWNTIPVQTGLTATNLSAGNYTVVVTDAHGCTSSTGVTVTTTTVPSVNAFAVNNVRCNNGTDGEAGVNVTGGTAPFTYLWVPSGGTASTAQNLHAGAYSVTVTDAAGCTSSSNVNITEPSAILLTTSSTDAACGQSNGSAEVIAIGGVGGFTYAWTSTPVQTTSLATNLPAGSYNVTVTDLNGCTTTSSVGVNNISGPVLAAGPSANVTCFDGNDGSLSVIATGGTGPYSYLWIPSGGTDTVARNLHAGAYSVSVTDSLGCISVLTGTVSEPPLLVADAGSNVSICAGTYVVLGNSPVASGGTPGYFYLWNPSNGLSSASDSTPTASPSSTTSYMLTVTDNHGCLGTASVVVTVNPIPAVPIVSVVSDSLFSTPSFSYQWYLDGTIINGFTSQYCVPFQNGDYAVVITDANGCSAQSADFHYASTAVSDFSFQITPVIFPNPAGDHLSIETKGLPGTAISIYNLVGEKLLASKEQLSGDIQSFDVSAFTPGIYMVEIISGEKIFRMKFLKD